MFLYFFFGDVVRNTASIGIIVIILFLTDARMALLTLAMIPVMFLLGYFFILKLSQKQRILHEKWDAMFGDIGNMLSSFMLTKMLFLEKVFLRKMSSDLDRIQIEQNRL